MVININSIAITAREQSFFKFLQVFRPKTVFLNGLCWVHPGTRVYFIEQGSEVTSGAALSSPMIIITDSEAALRVNRLLPTPLFSTRRNHLPRPATLCRRR